MKNNKNANNAYSFNPISLDEGMRKAAEAMRNNKYIVLDEDLCDFCQKVVEMRIVQRFVHFTSDLIPYVEEVEKYPNGAFVFRMEDGYVVIIKSAKFIELFNIAMALSKMAA